MMSPTNDTSALPKLDGELTLGKSLGQGGSGSVHVATQRSVGRTVAVKRLHSLRTPDAARRFQEEATIMGRVAHSNIVPVLMHGTLRGDPVLVMEHIDGLDLAEVVESLGRSQGAHSAFTLRQALHTDSLPWPDRTPWWKVAASILAQVARALDHAHHCGVLHRDIKPSNVLLSSRGVALLTDFGIALHGSVELGTSSARSTSGTFAYCSPEELDGAPPTQSSDLYSLGILARELVTLRSAYMERTSGVAARIRSISEGRLAPLSRRVPADLRAALTMATCMDPAQRYATTADFARDLENVAAGRPVFARSESRSQRTRRWLRQRSHGAAATTALGALLCITPATIQYSRLQAGRGVQAAAAAARDHLHLALTGIGEVLVQTAKNDLEGQPLLDLKRAQLLQTGADLGRDLAETVQKPATVQGDKGDGATQSLTDKAHALRIAALRGLISTERRLGSYDSARAHLEELNELFDSGTVDRNPLGEATDLMLACTLAVSSRSLERVDGLAVRALEVLEDASLSSREAHRLSANAWCARVEVAIEQGDLALAKRHGASGVEATRRWLDEAEEKAVPKRALAGVLVNYTAALIESNELDAAEALALESQDLLKDLPQAPDIRGLSAINWNNLGAIARNRGQFPASTEAELKSLSVQTELLGTSPRDVPLQFATARSHFRVGLSLVRQGDRNADALKHLEQSSSLLAALCSSHGATWKHHLQAATVHELRGSLARQRDDFGAAFSAYDDCTVSCAAAEDISPKHPELAPLLQRVWLMRTGLALSTKSGHPIEELDRYATAFPNDGVVAHNVASMLCKVANNAAAKATPEGAQLAENCRTRAIDYIEQLADAQQLKPEHLAEHPAWKSLHGIPRYQELVERMR